MPQGLCHHVGMSASISLFVTCPRGLEPLLATELLNLGALTAKERNGGVACEGELALAYRACLWSRLASRVLLPLTNFPLSSADDLYDGTLSVDWTGLMNPGASFSIEVAGRSQAVNHTHYAGLKVKDGVADCFRNKTGSRPNVDTANPDIRIHLHLSRDEATLSLDLSGESLHRRGYRSGTGEAPLKENLACAILLRAGWPDIAARGGALVDPMCGSGTFLIEAAWMAADIAPGLLREHFSFKAWTGHDPLLWREISRDAQSRRDKGLANLPRMMGRDIDGRVLNFARRSMHNAGLGDAIDWQQGDLVDARPLAAEGLLVCNPPYGERMAAEGEVIKLYSLLGTTLKTHFGGWRAAMLTSRADLAPRVGLRADAMHSFFNGDLPCKLLQFGINAPAPAPTAASDAPKAAVDIGDAAPFANRLAKNIKHLGKWARRSGTTCYRIYDADLPEYALAADLYQTVDQQTHLHVQEYAAPKTIDPIKAEKRLREALGALQQRFELPASNLHFKLRAVQRGSSQYEKQSENLKVMEVEEHGARLLVNLDDYLDTGLFLDHRALRLRIQKAAAGKRMLNLFCYTGAASVHAAVGGAEQTISVDLSNTYLHWAERNLRLNGMEADFQARPAMATGAGSSPWRGKSAATTASQAPHQLIRADCMTWLEQAAAEGTRSFDLIFCDPPTFSNSKKLEGVFDIQRDHLALVRNCAALLAPGGVLYFSTNMRRFKLDPAVSEGLEVSEITAATLDEDFKRGTPPHRCWEVRQAG